MKLNKYEKRLMLNTDIMKVLGIAGVLLNLLIPLFPEMGFKSIFQWLMVIIYVIGTLNAIGYFSQHVPIVPMAAVRGLESFYYYVISDGGIQTMSLMILVGFDLIFLAMFLVDKSNYTYVKGDQQT